MDFRYPSLHSRIDEQAMGLQYSVVTRSSLLAQQQTTMVIAAFKQAYPDANLTMTTLTTRGDHATGAIYHLKKAFVSELEEAVLTRKVDMAVHSLKDMSVFHQDDLCIAAVLPRGPVEDVLVSRAYMQLEDLPHAARVGTCSARRAAQLRCLRPDLTIALCRGNVQTRLQKLAHGQYDALMLAHAGLQRLALDQHRDFHVVPLAIDDFVPAGGQGVIAVQTHVQHTQLQCQLAVMNHRETYQAIVLERAIIRRFGGNCSMPLGVYVQPNTTGFVVRVFLGDVFGRVSIKKSFFWDYQPHGYLDKIEFLVKSVLDAGGQKILDRYQHDLAEVFHA